MAATATGMMTLALQKDFEPRYGEPVACSPLVTRVTAPNPSPFTFHGTMSYVVGAGEVVVIDPGPDDPGHRAALVAAIGGRPVAAILVTHSHRDHVDGVPAFRAEIGAPVLALPPAPRPGSATNGKDTADLGRAAGFVPDRLLADGEVLRIDGAVLETIATPGHAADHAAFALMGEDTLFSGDHVMGWSTTVVVPPDGHMGLYLASLKRLLERSERIYHPGHGGTIANGPAFARALLAHRLAREEAILARLAAGNEHIEEIVARLYRNLATSLVPAARCSVLAHLERLIERGRVSADPGPTLGARYRLT